MNRSMKWWGWGHPAQEFSIDDKPGLWPYISKTLGTAPDPKIMTNPPIALKDIQLPLAKRNEPFIAALQMPILFDNFERLLHTYGKSFRDLWRVRNGIVKWAPDCVCYPQSEEDVIQILKQAHEHNVVVIPFGGGSNIAGCLEARDEEDRMILSLDMTKMEKLVALDKQSKTATVQAGIMGPQLEKLLNEQGLTLGHFPDSFQHSSLGGWVATRSAGMQSDKYGKIEDMVISLRLITPQGKVITRTVPKSSNGIDLKHLCIGSEGILGVITQVVLQVHPLPAYKEYKGYLFPDFERGVHAIYECASSGLTPSMTRLNDPIKTALSFAFKTKGSKTQELLGKLVKLYLKKIKKLDFDKVSLLLVCFEGDQKQKKQAEAIYKKYGAVSLGNSPGKGFEKGKYDFPYIRDFVMDRGLIADVSETSTVWSNLLPLYYKAQNAIINAIKASGAPPFCGCHISHTYHTGASLYFTFACKQNPEQELAQYLSIKKAAEDAFMQNGGTLSHHHGVGIEHQPWMEEEFSTTGLSALQALKSSLDPKGIMNPGKIIPNELNLKGWHEK
jgi:alkyldihydroxyacetonephosphate synthase